MVSERELTNSEAAILGLLAEKPSYGYEIESIIHERGMSEWTEIAFSSIYYLLRKLEKKKLLTSKMITEGNRPPRKMYRPTGKGVKALRRAAIHMMSSPRRPKSDLDVGISLIPLLSREEIIEALGDYEESQRRRREHIKETMKDQGGEELPYFVRALFRRPLAHIETELAWVKRLKGQVTREHEKLLNHRE